MDMMKESNCLEVPLDALGVDHSTEGDMPGAGDNPDMPSAPKRVMPQVGDPVEFQVSGSIESVDGGTARVRVESINGEPMPEANAPASPADEESHMRRMASEADTAAGY